ncbi:MAG: hypothetical protein DDT36_01736 [Firmicutes bacterium]|nr:hypothetical protein [Bacillota bacterium]MBT9158718.1 hypothetical protein [Bacillota bacterium]
MKFDLQMLIRTAMMIALGVILPFAFHGIPGAGRVFLPMHIPAILAGLLFGPLSGFVSGALTPLVSSVLTGMPPLAPVPIAVQMSVELAIFGLLAGVSYRALRLHLMLSLIIAMFGGRLAYSIITLAFFPLFGLRPALLGVVFGTALTTAVPGLLLQFVAIPALVLAYEKFVGRR